MHTCVHIYIIYSKPSEWNQNITKSRRVHTPTSGGGGGHIKKEFAAYFGVMEGQRDDRKASLVKKNLLSMQKL